MKIRLMGDVGGQIASQNMLTFVDIENLSKPVIEFMLLQGGDGFQSPTFTGSRGVCMQRAVMGKNLTKPNVAKAIIEAN